MRSMGPDGHRLNVVTCRHLFDISEITGPRNIKFYRHAIAGDTYLRKCKAYVQMAISFHKHTCRPIFYMHAPTPKGCIKRK